MVIYHTLSVTPPQGERPGAGVAGGYEQAWAHPEQLRTGGDRRAPERHYRGGVPWTLTLTLTLALTMGLTARDDGMYALVGNWSQTTN